VNDELRRKARGETAHSHPVNVVHHDEASVGERVADRMSSGIGSWWFLIAQSVIIATWVVLNVVAIVRHWDPYPFFLLNFAFTFQAAYTGPVLLLAGNRQSQKDRLTLEHAAEEAEKADEQNVEILKAIEKNTEVTIQILRHVEALVSDHMADDTAKASQQGA